MDSSRNRNRRCQTGVLASSITLEHLQQLYHLPAHVACVKLGVSLSVLKRICRKRGLARWPYKLGTPRDPPTLQAVRVGTPSPAHPATPLSTPPTSALAVAASREAVSEATSCPVSGANSPIASSSSSPSPCAHAPGQLPTGLEALAAAASALGSGRSSAFMPWSPPEQQQQQPGQRAGQARALGSSSHHGPCMPGSCHPAVQAAAPPSVPFLRAAARKPASHQPMDWHGAQDMHVQVPVLSMPSMPASAPAISLRPAAPIAAVGPHGVPCVAGWCPAAPRGAGTIGSSSGGSRGGDTGSPGNTVWLPRSNQSFEGMCVEVQQVETAPPVPATLATQVQQQEQLQSRSDLVQEQTTTAPMLYCGAQLLRLPPEQPLAAAALTGGPLLRPAQVQHSTAPALPAVSAHAAYPVPSDPAFPHGAAVAPPSELVQLLGRGLSMLSREPNHPLASQLAQAVQGAAHAAGMEGILQPQRAPYLPQPAATQQQQQQQQQQLSPSPVQQQEQQPRGQAFPGAGVAQPGDTKTGAAGGAQQQGAGQGMPSGAAVDAAVKRLKQRLALRFLLDFAAKKGFKVVSIERGRNAPAPDLVQQR